MKKIITLTLILLFAVVGISNSQNGQAEKTRQLPSIALGVGTLSFDGNLGKGLGLSSLSKIRTGYNFVLEQRIGRVIGLSFNGIYGKLADNQEGAVNNLNFQSTIIQTDLNLVLHLDNGFLFESNSIFAPYLSVGFGYTQFSSYADLKDKNGNPYYYSPTGVIKDGIDTTKVIHRDYSYETKLNDSGKYVNHTFALPIGLGVNLKIVDRFYVNLGAAYYFTFCNNIDNVNKGPNEKYLFVKIGFQYNFGKPYDDSNPVYKTVDFSSLDKLDSDGDGVKDGDDRCPGTPKDVKVDKFGCPIDSDEDGVPDYMDKEPLTKKGAFVDEKGVTKTEKMIAEQQAEFNKSAIDHSDIIKIYPSLGKLKEYEKGISKGGKKGSKDIPFALKSADLNKDNYISTEEIGKAIDSFFEGDSDFTVEKLNDLIDYFFEQ